MADPKKTFYITTPIYYVNDVPHIGHAYTTLACDVIARYKRLAGEEVLFLTGTDEHGQKVEKSAQQRGMAVQDFVDQVSDRFRQLLEVMGYSCDDFIRTTESRHKEAACALWQKLVEKGYIYRGCYSGWYAVRDEAFYQESELHDGKAPTGAEVEWVEEESYFFRLSAFQDQLLAFYRSHPAFVQPEYRFKEVIHFVQGGKDYVAGSLRDLSVSRTTFSWGVPVPGDKDHVMYVWLDALVNYLSALGYPDSDALRFQAFWPAQIHMVGKDIMRFHAVYWPAFLMAADLPLPEKIVAHGWWTNEGEKISKSLGNTIDPLQLVKEFGVDQVRYFLMREVPFGGDGNYSRQSIVHRANGELANILGNLVQRVMSMVAKNCQSCVPQPGSLTEEDRSLWNVDRDLLDEYLQKQSFSEMLEYMFTRARSANIYVDHQAPWRLKKEDPVRMASVLYVLLECIRRLAIILQPFIPQAAARILDGLHIEQDRRSFRYLDEHYALLPGSSVTPPELLFTKVEI